MRSWIIVVAGVAVAIGLGVHALPTRSAGPHDTVEVTSAGSGVSVSSSGSTPIVATVPVQVAAPVPDAVGAAEPEGAPKNYQYWENDEAGDWATPAEFSAAD